LLGWGFWVSLWGVYWLFFDLDGTLTDPAVGITACFAHAIRGLGRPAWSAAELRRFIGPPMRDAFGEILGTDDPVEIERGVRLYRERYVDVGIFENTLHPGLPQVLSLLRSEGFGLSVVTSKAKLHADRIIDHFALREFFDNVYGAELSGERSTKTELVADALKAEGVQAGRACMIGDRSYDVVGAKANGVACIGVAWGYGSRNELHAAGADLVVGAVDELPAASRTLRDRVLEVTPGEHP
jgi:phosphoglycolate phosphatase